MTAKFENQSSDRENSKPAPACSKPGDDLKQTMSASAQKLAQGKANLGGLDGEQK